MGQIGSAKVVDGLKGEQGELEVDVLLDREAVEIL